jgi:hypothetical protein
LLHGGNIVDSLEKKGFLVVVLHESVNEDGVSLRVNIFHHHLEAVKATGFGHLDLCAETLSQILKHDTVGGSEERENVLDKVLLIWREFEPVLGVLAEIDLVNSPEAGHLVLVHLPDVLILDGKDNEPVRVFLKERLRENLLSVLTLADVLRRDNLRRGATVSRVVLVEKLGSG